MDEEDKKEIKETGEEVTTPAKDDGVKYETTPVIERAREERVKLEAANKERKELLDREEAIMAKRELGGRAEAGQSNVEKKEESPAEYRARINKEMAGGKTEW